jgi:hypothetical protein
MDVERLNRKVAKLYATQADAQVAPEIDESV